MDFVALELIRNLQKIDKKNEYLVFVQPDSDKCLHDSDNFKIVELAGGSYPFWEQKALPKAVEEYGCDLLHCTSNTAPIHLNVPLVVIVHDIIYLESISVFKKGGTLYQKLGNLYRRWNVPQAIRNASYVTTVSEFEKGTIAARFPDYQYKIKAIYNGVSEHFKPVSDSQKLKSIQEKYGLPSGFLFYLGNTDPKKNTPNVLKAFADYVDQVKDPLPLVMIDLGDAAMKRMLKDIGAPDLMKHIHVSGYIDNTDLPAIYSMCNVFLYPSLRESFGIPILEGMRSGAPVITSNTSCMPEIAGDAAYFVDPYKPEQITNAIIELESNAGLKKSLIDKGLSRAALFSWENMARNFLDLYQTI